MNAKIHAIQNIADLREIVSVLKQIRDNQAIQTAAINEVMKHLKQPPKV
jgi:hypothetical protein